MYKFFGIHFKRWLWLFWPFSFLFRVKIFPMSLTKENFQERVNDKSVVYILPKMSIIDILVLNRALKKLKQPPVKTEANSKHISRSSVLAVKASFFFQNDDKSLFINEIVNLLNADKIQNEHKFLFLPVSVYWSRAAERNEKGFLLRSLFPDDGTGNVLQKLFMLILHRGEVNVSFGKEIEIYLDNENQLIEKIDNSTTHNLDLAYAKRLHRQLLIEFAKDRTAFLGPVLYEKDKIIQWILSSEQTNAFLMHSEQPEKTKYQIVKYIHEIAANYHYTTLRAAEQIFDFIWTKVFTGIRVRNYEKVERVVKENCVIWMPCHRSHFDYLLLNYLLFKHGAIAPHVAAGINLNFWPLGPFLRSGGAFFIRRSFSGNKTYTHTFSEYVNFLLHNSYPIEFFPEGGRSRIGKLLPPKIGMLSICLQSVMHRKAENTYLMPVSINYDKVMEDNTYAKELKGAKKQKENVLQFLNGIRKVFANYGSVDVSFGEPILISKVWEEYVKKNESQTGQPFLSASFKNLPDNVDTRDPRIQSFVKYLGFRVHQKINGAATASSTALLSTVLLANAKTNSLSPNSLLLYMMLLHHTVSYLGQELNWKIATSKVVDNVFDYISLNLDLNSKEDKNDLLAEQKFESVEKFNEEYVQMGKNWQLLLEKNENDHVFYSKNPEKEFNLWWYRGTTFHIFAIVGVLAKALLSCDRYQISSLELIFENIRKLWRDELFWDDDTSNKQLIIAALNLFHSLKIIHFDGEYIQLERSKLNFQNSIDVLGTNVLPFYANIIRPEVELHGLLMAVALFFIEKKRYFERHELLEKAFIVHETAFKQGYTSYASTFVKVFGNAIFDNFVRQNIFVHSERKRFVAEMILIGGIAEFFDMNKWKNFLV